jgi:phosphonate transport system permease protein
VATPLRLLLEWQQASFLILMVLVTVAAIDALSQRLRGAIMGRRRDR